MLEANLELGIPRRDMYFRVQIERIIEDFFRWQCFDLNEC